MNPRPVMRLTVDPQADCKSVAATRALLDEAANCKDGRWCGEGKGEWEAGPNIVSIEGEAANLADQALE